MKIKKQFLMVCAVIPMFCCGIGQKAKAVSQDFDSFTNGTALNSVSGWQAPADYVIRQNTQIDEFSTNAGSLGYPDVVYGSAGYTNSQGVEADFQTSSTGNNLTRVRGALWTLSGGNAVSQNGAVFQAQVRLSSYGIGGSGNTNTVADANNGFELLVGSGFNFVTNGANLEYDYTNATAFGLYFYDNGTESPAGYRLYTDLVGNSDTVHGTNGFSMSILTQWTSFVANWTRDTWYTVQLSNIVFTSVSMTNATALLTVYESDNPSVMLYSNVLIRSQSGPKASGGLVEATNMVTGGVSGNWVTAGLFTNINQIAFGEGRFNGVDTIDNISLVAPAGPSPIEFSSIVEQGNDINLTWQTSGGQTDVVQAATGNVAGLFEDISGPIVIQGSGSQTTNYVDAGAVLNQATRFYRVRVAP
jgi:hypothetical protein